MSIKRTDPPAFAGITTCKSTSTCSPPPSVRTCDGLKLVIIHNHFRPGGVRRVIELATPPLCRLLRPRITSLILAGGEPPDATWWQHFRESLPPIPAECRIEKALGYLAEQKAGPAKVAAQLRRFLADLLEPSGECLVWAHNQGLGRNLLLTRELHRACADSTHCRLVFHHHDWWFDNRWQRWPAMRKAGFTSPRKVAATILPVIPNVRHIAINRADASVLHDHFPHQSGWLPNPSPAIEHSTARRLRHARVWLAQLLGRPAPVWLMPCRLLRRKNIAEALLLTRWLRPDAWLLTTAGVSSAEEQPYADRLAAAARQHHWRLRLGILHEQEPSAPALVDLLAASEVLVLTSLQEGFGLPYLEAATAHRPLIARALPNIAPDLDDFGLRFPHSYSDLIIHPALFNWPVERERQARLFHLWKTSLPAEYRKLAATPALLAARRGPEPVPFSRLTLSAQLEVLSCPVEESWHRCEPLNPWLTGRRDLACRGRLRVSSWPRSAERCLSGPNLVRRFSQILTTAPVFPPPPSASTAAQEEFVRHRLQAQNLYPLTWSPQT